MRSILLFLLLAFSSCTREAWHAPMARTDTLRLSKLTGLPAADKIKIGGSLIIQTGNGNQAADNTKAGQRANAAAIGPGAVAAATARPTPLWAFGLLVAGGLGIGFWFRGKVPSLPF